MIEARSQMRTELERVSANYSDVEFAIALLGSSERIDVSFHVQGSGSSIYRERSDTGSSLEKIAMTTLDKIIPTSLHEPFFLKLDVQGAELDILRGGNATLEKTEAVQLELPLLCYNEGAPISSEVVSFMNDRGFALYDISGFVRPFGKHLVQIDTIFVRKESKLRPDKFQFNGAYTKSH
jgi:FkbM family methyltransferase